MTADANETMRVVISLKATASKQKDVLKVNCVNDKLVQLKAQLNIQESTAQELQVALGKNSDDRVSLFAQLSATSDSIHQLREEAKACVGASELYKQEAGATVEKPDIPDDPTIPPDGWGIIVVEPPNTASPYN